MDKKGWIILVLLLIPIISAGITGQATNQETGVSVTVIDNVPSLEILSPTATTYTEGDYILLDWNENLIDTVWYNLNQGTNITINTSFYFQTSVGTHTLYLYGNQSNGTILLDQVTFNVQSAPSGGGGGRREEVPEEVGVTPEKEIFPLTLKQGETKEIKLLLKNEENIEKKIKLVDLNLNDLLIKTNYIEFYLKPGQSKEVTVTFYADKEKTPDLYIEKLLIVTEEYEKEISFHIEVESIGFLFDVRVEIPEEPSIFAPGEELIANVDFYNLGKQGEAEVNIEYVIKDEQENIIFGEKQILIIVPSVSLTKRLQLPNNIEEGDYIFYVTAEYDSKTAIASKWFKVSKTKGKEKIILLKEALIKYKDKIISIIVILVVGYGLIILLKRVYGKEKKQKAPLRTYKKRVKKKINRNK